MTTLEQQKLRGDAIVAAMAKIDQTLGGTTMRTLKSKVDLDPADDKWVEDLVSHLSDKTGLKKSEVRDHLKSFLNSRDDDDDGNGDGDDGRRQRKQAERGLKQLVRDKIEFVTNPPITPAIFTAKPLNGQPRQLKRVDGGCFGTRYFPE